MLDEICLKLRMNSSISNGIMTFNELHKVTSGIMWHQLKSTIIDLIIIKVICSKVSMSLIFNDHIMQYYTCLHNVLKCFKVEKMCMPTHNYTSRLKHSKCTFDILPTSLLCGSKMLSFTVLWCWNCFDKCCPWWIYTICKIVPHQIVITIHWVINWRSMLFSKLRNYRRPL